MPAGIAVAPFAPEPSPPAPTAPSVQLIGGRSTSFPAWPVRIPTLSFWDIAASMSFARAAGESEVLHQGWCPQRPAASAATGSANPNASATIAGSRLAATPHHARITGFNRVLRARASGCGRHANLRVNRLCEAVYLIAELRDPLRQLGVLAKQLGLRIRQLLAVPRIRLLLGLVTVGLPRLREQDQPRRVRGLGREREVAQDARIRVPPDADRGAVQRDPRDHQECLAKDVSRGPEETSDPLRDLAEPIRPERAVQVGVLGLVLRVRVGDGRGLHYSSFLG